VHAIALLCFAYTVRHQAYAFRILSFKKIKLVKVLPKKDKKRRKVKQEAERD